MHTKPMKESDGAFRDIGQRAGITCGQCGGDQVTVKIWESSCGGYEDAKYNCPNCGAHWWVEGPDA